MSIDDLAQRIRANGLVLAEGSQGAVLAWRYSGLDPGLRRQIRNRRRALARLLASGDVRVCCAPGLHRASWFYAGKNQYCCAYCVRLDTALGLWSDVA